MAQLMPLPLTVSCFNNITIGFTFLVPVHPGSSGQTVVKMGVCVQLEITPNLPRIFISSGLKVWQRNARLVGGQRRHDADKAEVSDGEVEQE